jgi:FkbM family methyltransferase
MRTGSRAFPLVKGVKRTLKGVPLLGSLLAEAWYDRHDPVRRIRRVLDPDKSLSIVQIGSHNGRTLDPLHNLIIKNKNWRALFVEPFPSLFERLRANYGDEPRFQFENVAIAKDEGELPFYHISPATTSQMPDLPFWYDQLGSLNEDHIRSLVSEEAIGFIEKANVPAISLKNYWAEQGRNYRLSPHRCRRTRLGYLKTARSGNLSAAGDSCRAHASRLVFETAAAPLSARLQNSMTLARTTFVFVVLLRTRQRVKRWCGTGDARGVRKHPVL